MRLIEKFEMGLPILFLMGLLLSFQQVWVGKWMVLLALGLGFGINLRKILQKTPNVPFSASTLWIVRLLYICLSMMLVGVGLKVLGVGVAEKVLTYILLAFLPILIMFLFDFRFSTSWAVVTHHKKLLVKSLLIGAIGFLFYVTPSIKISKLFQIQKIEEKR